MIGILKDTTPHEMVDLDLAADARPRRFGRARPTILCFALREGAEPVTLRGRSSRRSSPTESRPRRRRSMDDTLAAQKTFNWIIEGFMGLGLVVGVAARRHQRPRRRRAPAADRRDPRDQLPPRMIQLAFLLESSFIDLTAISWGRRSA